MRILTKGWRMFFKLGFDNNFILRSDFKWTAIENVFSEVTEILSKIYFFADVQIEF